MQPSASKWLLAIIAGTLVALLAWQYWPQPDDRQPNAPDDASDPTSRIAANPARASAGTEARIDDLDIHGRVQSSDGTSDPTADVSKHQVWLTASVTGRCVDQNGRMVPNAAVVIEPHELNLEWVKTVRNEGERHRFEYETVANAEGRFTVEFPAAPSQGFRLQLSAAGHATRKWEELGLDSDGVAQLGDCAIPTARVLAGQVTEPDGTSVADAQLTFKAQSLDFHAARRELRTWFSTESSTSGAYAIDEPMPAGNYTVEVDGRAVQSPEAEFRFDAHGQEPLRIVVASLSALDRIRGRLLDQDGRAVEGLRVFALNRQDKDWSTPSNAEGEFEISRDPSVDARPVQLRVDVGMFRSKFSPLVTEEFVPWGQEDLQLVLHRAPTATIRVTAADTGQPVEDYVVNLVPQRAIQATIWAQESNLGHHPNGECTVAGLWLGDYFMQVVPTDEAPSHLTASAPVAVQFPGRRHVVLEVQLPVAASRRVIVHDASGKPLAEAEVRLIDIRDLPLDQFDEPRSFGRWSNEEFNMPIILSTGTTDAQGSVELHGVQGGLHSLLVAHPNHANHVEHNVTFDAPEPLLVQLSAGATLTVQIGPEAALAQMFRNAGQRIGQPRASLTKRLRPTVWFRPLNLGPVDRDTDENEAVLVDPDGKLRFTGLPAGDGALWLRCAQYRTSQSWIWSYRFLARVEGLESGEDRSITLDLSALTGTAIAGLVLLNSEPAASTTLRFTLQSESTTAPERSLVRRSFRTAEDGSFTAELTPGTWTAHVFPNRPGMPNVSIPALQPLVVQAGRPVTGLVLTIASSICEYTVLDSTGAPCAGVEVDWLDAKHRSVASFSNTFTDHNGVARIELPPGSYEGRTRRRHLQGLDAWRHHRQIHGEDTATLAKAYVDVGTLAVTAGVAPSPMVFRLPSRW